LEHELTVGRERVSAPFPPNEEARLAALRGYDVLDSAPELAFDDLVRLASTICGTPIAAISLIDNDRQWFKAMHGSSLTSTPREDAFCAHAILQPSETLVVENAALDDRFADNPLVTAGPRIRFYAGAPLVDPEGNALGTLCVISPEPKELSDEQKSALEALSRQVMAQLELRRTVKQLEQQSENLSEALVVAEESNRAKQTFLTNMSHELRTPLNGLIGVTDLLRTTPLNAKQTRYLDTIRKSGQNLLSVLTTILEFSENRSGRIDLIPQATELVPLIRDIVDLMQPAALAKGLHLSWGVDSALHRPCLVDALRLRQVLANLVGNGIKFTEQGTVEIRVRKVQQAREKPRIRFEIEDSGIGIPADRLQTIFGEFVQVDDGPARVYGGTGLGLATSRAIVERMGGELNVTSAVGQGSVFSFDIELEPAGPAHGRHRVLVVEDNEVNTIVITAMLEQNGCVVEHAANGLEAVRKLQQERFDMVFMDLQMPEMDGVTATREVRAMEPEEERTPIVAVTASAMDEDEQICRQAGMDGLIRKPINDRIIAEALHRFLA
jgi:signal transduction histidine kinase